MPCYRVSRQDEFPIQKYYKKRVLRFLERKMRILTWSLEKGGDLMCLFQWEVSHLRNMERRDPDSGGGDDKF